MGRWRKWQFKPRYDYRVVLPQASITMWLSYANRGEDWRVEQQGFNLASWFREHGKGLMRFSFYPDTSVEMYCADVEVGFTDRNTALLCKLQMGGQ